MKKWLDQKTIRKRMLTTFFIILAVFCCTVVLAICGMFSIGGNFKQFYKGPYVIVNRAAAMQKDIQTVAKYVGYSMMEDDSAKTKEYVSNAETAIESLKDGTEFMRKNFRGDASIIENYDKVMNDIKDAREKVFELAKNNQNAEAIEIYFSDVMPGFVEANGYLQQISDFASNTADSKYGAANVQKNLVTGVLVVLAVLTFGVTLYLACYIIASITNPLKGLEEAAKKMSIGNFHSEIAYASNDELGSLAESMRTMTNNIQSVVKDLQYLLGELGVGNFRVTSKDVAAYKEDYAPILAAMRLIRDTLNASMEKINEATNQVAAGAGQLADNAQGLAEGATEQAGAVQELTATVENVSDMAETTAERSKLAYTQAQESVEKAKDGRREMDELIHAMERISATSKEIENIIGAIEDIASQTNLLSLNASIEAARAGEAGKGFAVVADQIGKLASDSAQSAVNTKELIGKTLEEIDFGNKITMQTSEAFEEVIEEMKKLADTVSDSSEASMTQYHSLKQVLDGIEQISFVVQSNSAAAEETSATSEELSAQSESLREQVAQFKLLEE